jgi:hypothetical protein
MNREITLEQHKVEAIGLWWINLQGHMKDVIIRQAKERARRQAMSPRAFVTEHLGCSDSESTKTSLSESSSSQE